VYVPLRERISDVVDIYVEEGWTKDGAMRDSVSDSKRAISSTTEEDLCSSVCLSLDKVDFGCYL